MTMCPRITWCEQSTRSSTVSSSTARARGCPATRHPPTQLSPPHYAQHSALLTEGAVRASDKRAQFVGIDACQAAGGDVMRDLFQQDDGGWLQDWYSTQR